MTPPGAYWAPIGPARLVRAWLLPALARCPARRHGPRLGAVAGREGAAHTRGGTMTETKPTAAGAKFYPLVDRRCTHFRCAEPDVYRMVGHCTNCGTGPLLVLLSAGHDVSHEGQCPKCGCRKVHCDRLAADDELPESTP